MAEVRRIGNFELLEKIGQGGMGAVFKARQISMDRIVALKVLPPTLAKQQKFIERFVREARASARLNHPNIVNGIDVGHDGGLYYFAMELVEGQSLKEVIEKKGKLSEKETIPIAKAMALALSHAHAHNILHRDIKPDNILVDTHGTPKLCDLGLARLDTDSEIEKGLTQQGQAVGTPHYISPEQARGEHNLDAKTDLYSLGATLYHMLTGATMFDAATSVLVMTKHITEKAPHPSDKDVQLSRGMLQVLAKLLVKDRNDRYANAAKLTEDLELIGEGKAPVNAELPSNKWPFSGTGVNTGALTKRPNLPAQASAHNAEKVRYPRRETRNMRAVGVGRYVPLAIIVILIGAAAWFYTSSKNKVAYVVEDPAKTAVPPRDVVVPAAPVNPVTKPASVEAQQKPVVLPRVAPQANTLGFKKPVETNVRVAPKAEGLGFKPPPIVSQGSGSGVEASNLTPGATPNVPSTAVQPVEPVAPKFPPPQKTVAGSDLASLMARAVQLSAESKYREAAELFNLRAERVKAMDDFDRELLEIHIESYAGLCEMKPMVIERLVSNPTKLEAAKVFTKKLGGKIVGGDEKSLFIKDQQVDLKYDWQRLSTDELLSLTIQAVGVVPPRVSLGLGVLGYDQGDDTFARKMLGNLSIPHAKRILDLIDLRDKALIAKKIAETSAYAEKLMADIDIAMSAANFNGVIVKSNALRAKYSDVEKVKERRAELDAMLELAKIAEKTGATIDAGNVALEAAGASVVGTTPDLIDGNSTRFNGSVGFSNCVVTTDPTITLAKTYILREIRLLLWDLNERRYYQYKVEVSADGQTFAPLADCSRGEYRSWQTLKFAPRPVKALKFVPIAGVSSSVHVVELEAYCKPPDEPAVPKAASIPAPGDGMK